MILIDATTLIHKSTLSMNNFRNNHFGQKYQKEIFFKILEVYRGGCLKNFQRVERKLDRFLTNFPFS